MGRSRTVHDSTMRRSTCRQDAFALSTNPGSITRAREPRVCHIHHGLFTALADGYTRSTFQDLEGLAPAQAHGPESGARQVQKCRMSPTHGTAGIWVHDSRADGLTRGCSNGSTIHDRTIHCSGTRILCTRVAAPSQSRIPTPADSRSKCDSDS